LQSEWMHASRMLAGINAQRPCNRINSFPIDDFNGA
jgi:hypothetical protein